MKAKVKIWDNKLVAYDENGEEFLVLEAKILTVHDLRTGVRR